MATASDQHRKWLEAEREGRDDLAELSFSRLMADLPAVDPGPDFVARAVQVAWRARARRRMVARLARAAAAVAIAAASVGAMYVFGILVLSGLVHGTALFARGLVWLMTSFSGGARWWSIAGRVGTTVGQTVSAPQTTVLVAALELMGALAIYALQRVLHGRGSHDSQRQAYD